MIILAQVSNTWASPSRAFFWYYLQSMFMLEFFFIINKLEGDKGDVRKNQN